MKKSKTLTLSTVFAVALASCGNSHNQWIGGYEDDACQDTVVNCIPYRYYYGCWYPVYHGLINPYRYQGVSLEEIYSLTYHSPKIGGFGSSAHSYAGG